MRGYYYSKKQARKAYKKDKTKDTIVVLLIKFIVGFFGG